MNTYLLPGHWLNLLWPAGGMFNIIEYNSILK